MLQKLFYLVLVTHEKTWHWLKYFATCSFVCKYLRGFFRYSKAYFFSVHIACDY